MQGGKDGILRLLQLHRLPGVNATTGGELQTTPAPGPTDVFFGAGGLEREWVFVATGGGTEALLFKGGRLHPVWSNRTDGTSPVVAGSLLYVAGSGAVHVYVPTSGREVATLPTGSVHWQSPIVADGRVAIPLGNANDHVTSGQLLIFSRAREAARSHSRDGVLRRARPVRCRGSRRRTASRPRRAFHGSRLRDSGSR